MHNPGGRRISRYNIPDEYSVFQRCFAVNRYNPYSKVYYGCPPVEPFFHGFHCAFYLRFHGVISFLNFLLQREGKQEVWGQLQSLVSRFWLPLSIHRMVFVSAALPQTAEIPLLALWFRSVSTTILPHDRVPSTKAKGRPIVAYDSPQDAGHG